MERLQGHLRTLIVAAVAALLAFAPSAAHARAAAAIEWNVTVSYELGPVDADAYDAAAEADAGDEGAALVADDSADPAEDSGTQQRYVPMPDRADAARGGAYGPFRVVGNRVRMIGDIDSDTPRAFARLLRAHPDVTVLDMVECPGSLDDSANLELARMVRRAGLATHIPAGGSVRSGAVELFLAGVKRTAAPDAEFGVHSWRDEDGMEARDFPIDHPAHAEYLAYYRDMGMTDAQARAFYSFTNRTGFDTLHRMTRAEIAQYGLLN